MLGIYCRISKDRPNQKSIKEQRERGIEFANKNGWEHKVYEDVGVSGGKSIEERPGLYDMVTDIQNDLISSVFYYNQDRLERNELTWLTLSQLLIDNNISIYENGSFIDLNNPDVKLLTSIKSSLNEHKKSITAIKIKDVLKRNASEGRAHARTPNGYGKDENGYIIINEDESKIVNEIYDMSLEGMGVQRIANYLNSHDIPTQYNKMGGTYSPTNRHSGEQDKVLDKKNTNWASATIHHILTNPHYKGERIFSGNTYEVPIIIPKDKWEKVQKNLKKNRSFSGKKTKYNYLIKGKLICGKCGRYYHGRTRKNKKDHYYQCGSKRIKENNCGNRSINIDVIEDFIWQRFFVEERLLERLNDYYNNTDIQEKINDIELNIKHKKRLLKKLDQEKRRIRLLLIEGTFKEEDEKEELNRVRDQISGIEKEIAILINDKSTYKDIKENQESNLNGLEEIKANASFNQKQKLIIEYIHKIKITELKDQSCFWLKLYFNKIIEDVEDYFIPYPNYEFAMEPCTMYMIPLNDDFKRWNQEDLHWLNWEINRRSGKTQVEYRLTDDCDGEIYFVWLNQNNWEKEFDDFCKRRNINGHIVSNTVPYKEDERSLLDNH